MRKPHRGGISIHAPPRGATSWLREIDSRGAISIHAPPRGATYVEAPAMPGQRISIHAPPRGATGSFRPCDQPCAFQFTPLREGRPGMRARRRLQVYFNSRPSARGDFPGVRESGRRENFNSRPSARGDMISLFGAFVKPFQFTPLREGRPARRCNAGVHARRISIHAPPRGATEWADFTGDFFRISIHAPPRGATWRLAALAGGSAISIHAPPRGATRTTGKGPGINLYFNSRPSARGDRMAISCSISLRRISIHAPPRGATAKDMQFLQIFCSTLTNQHGLTIMPRNLSRLFW